jgi:hypothetical protein
MALGFCYESRVHFGKASRRKTVNCHCTLIRTLWDTISRKAPESNDNRARRNGPDKVEASKEVEKTTLEATQ